MATLRFGGGLNQLSDELVHAEECIEGENFLLDADSKDFHPRLAFDLKGTATNGKPVSGIMQLVKRDNTETTLVQAEHVVYTWNGASTWTPVSTVATNALLRGTYWSLDDILVMTDVSKAEVVKKWNGTAVSTMTHAIPGVTNLYAKYGLVFDGRLWLFNIKTDSTDLPHVCIASAFEDYDSFDTTKTPTSTTLTANVAFFLTSKDLKPINGAAVFYGSLIISTIDGKLFKITGDSAVNYQVDEFYQGSAATGEELLVNTGNDLMFIRKGGKIERLRATEQFGDTAADDVSKQIPDEVADISSGLAIYDQTKQRVCFFVNNSILVLDKYMLETNELSPWMLWTTQMSSNLDVDAAAYIKRPGTSNYSVYFGGPSGQVYDMNGTGSGDAGSILIRTFRKTKLISELPTVDNNIMGRVTYKRNGACVLQMNYDWTDEYTTTVNSISLKGPITSNGTYFWGSSETPSYFGGTTYWGTGGVSTPNTSTAGFSAVGKGPSFFLTTTVNTTVAFRITRIDVP